jgi:acetyl-CoA/propionyl-CoA carboxylase biotin carboxyl carrier protein
VERLAPGEPPFSDDQVAHAAALITLARRHQRRSDDPFDRADGWRLGGRRSGSWWRLTVGPGSPVQLCLEPLDSHELERTGSHTWAITTAGDRREWSYAADGDLIWVGCDGHAWPVRASSATAAETAHADGDLRAPMPGQVLLLPAAQGDLVRAGDPVVVLESMKMELILTAPVDGAVAELNVAVGDTVTVDQPLARVESAG